MPNYHSRLCEFLDYATAYGDLDEGSPNGTVTPVSGSPMDDRRREAIRFLTAARELAAVIENPIHERRRPLHRSISIPERDAAALVAGIVERLEPKTGPIALDLVSANQFVARTQADALDEIAVPLIEELSKKPSTVWGDIVKAFRAKASELKDL